MFFDPPIETFPGAEIIRDLREVVRNIEFERVANGIRRLRQNDRVARLIGRTVL